MSISVNPSALSASVVNSSIVSRHTDASCGSSNSRACVSSKKALSLVKLLRRNSTQCFSSGDTAYFFAVYSVVITVSGPICNWSVYRKSRTAKNATGSTSGTSISGDDVARVPLNMASNTALPDDSTSLWAGIRCCWAPRPTRNLTSARISLLKRKANLSFIVALLPCQLYGAGAELWSWTLSKDESLLGRASRCSVFIELLGGRLQSHVKS